MSLLIVAALSAAEPVDWGARLAADAERFRAVVLDSHPGPVDPENPSFRATLEAAYAQAMRRARTTRSAAAYRWALDEISAAFDDGHLGIHDGGQAEAVGQPRLVWPGFLTRLKGWRHFVVSSEEAAVPTGAALVGCDSTDADRLAAERIGRFTARWSLRATREQHAVWLFLPPDNPWLRPIGRCTFELRGATRRVPLNWRPIEGEKLDVVLASIEPRHRSPISLERLADGGYWINMGSFESDPATPDGKALTALNAAIARDADAIRRAPRVVFDLRGNNGGSSAWSKQAAEAIWGAGAVAARSRLWDRVDWRVSDANLATVRSYQAKFEPQRATNPYPYEWATKVATGLERARAERRALWSERPERDPTEGGVTHPVSARAYVLTDNGCGSACLDAVDVLTAMGAVQVGRETSADTLYMEIRREVLASGAVLWVPMKVYRGRPRGSNVPATPLHEWTGDMGNTAAIRRWIAGL